MNLVVTCPRHAEEYTLEELADIAGDAIEARQTGISGVLAATVQSDPVEFARKVRDMVVEEPWSVRYVRRIIPVQEVVRTTLDEIEGGVRRLRGAISEGERWRVSVEKRNTSLSGMSIIERIASVIPNSVSLEEPDRIVQVEVLGGTTGISVIRPGDIFSLDAAKRSLAED